MSAPAISNEKIPNNVDLSGDKRLQRALEAWQPNFINWWKEMGPEGFQTKDIYLRTAISVDVDGWANFGHVKMPDYRWGIFLEPKKEGRTIGFGDHMGEPAWQEVPGEHRNALRRLIVTQGDTEPASVEQQRLLGQTAPSLYDLRNLFQVNVEEGRHLWAMVYLLHTYFGRDGREEAEAMLERRSGNADKPRILTTFNEPIQDWLSFFCFTMFTDRDGKYQLLSLAESGFDPLARTCRFMLTEEAHHMFVGETGVLRVVERAAELTRQHGTMDIFKFGGVPLPVIQKYINFWYTSSLDLFGAEVSTNAAQFFANGLKGRAYEERDYTDHRLTEGSYKIEKLENGKVVTEEVPIRNALNEVLRDGYVEDNERGVRKWNKALGKHGIENFEFRLPNRRFNRTVGLYAGQHVDLAGQPITAEQSQALRAAALPSAEDRAQVMALMKPVYEPGKMAGWIAPPSRGINEQPVAYDYVKM